MSDHGFASWRRVFHLNAWLHQNGYLAVKDASLPEGQDYFRNVDWSKTKAYALGLNGLYVNQKGREKDGIVPESERAALLAEIKRKLEGTIDPATKQPAVSRAFLREQTYSDGGYRSIGPDMVVGYAEGTRTSDESALGAVGREVLTDNEKPWSGDHCMDPAGVPGILATSRPLKKPAPALKDLAAAILAEYGVTTFPASAKVAAAQKQ
jgi:predicted AlkP superfamily phosphohydrolase/phosphomutase